jgi:hypothetical protein
VDTANPAECIARRAVHSFGLESNYYLEAVLRHGLVDLVPGHSSRLFKGLYGSVGEPDAKMDSPEEQLLDSSASRALRRSPHRPVLAAMALVAAARHEADPFANPIYLKLARQAKDDPRIPVLALSLWSQIIAMSGSPPDFWVTHAGLPAIWDRAMTRKEADAPLIEDLVYSVNFLDEFKPRTRAFFVWYAQRPGLTVEQRVSMASQLARFFDMPDEAASLLAGIGADVEGFDMAGVRATLAAARLARGYDAESARLLAGRILDDLAKNGVRWGAFGSDFTREREALERASAHQELRELAAEYLRHAQALDGKAASADWYAAASDLYLRAGDVARARELARLGLPYVPELVRAATRDLGGVDRENPGALAIAAQGRGTAPVIALYRAGAIDEALKTRYLTGKDRYSNAERAGEKKDPQWVLDDDWPSYIGVMAREASSSSDRDFQRHAYDGLVRSCQKPLADCFSETLREIAQVAAGMGDEARMTEALAAAARQLGGFAGFSALYVAGPWAHCEEILRAHH